MSKPQKAFNKKKILQLIDRILEHNYFKAVCISIIISFLIFNSAIYFKNYFLQKSEVEPTHQRIKINIGNFKEKLNQIDGQKLKYIIKSGETLGEILFSLGTSQEDVVNILKSTKKIFNPRRISEGQELIIFYKTIVSYEDDDPEKKLLRQSIISKLSLSPDPEISMNITRSSNGSYDSKRKKKELVKRIVKYNTKISNSLFVDAVAVGVSPAIMINIIDLYSFDIDFQRDLRRGDEFGVLYEEYYDKEGNKIKNGNILYSSMNLKTSSKPLEAYLYEYKNTYEYFDQNGNSIRKSLLKTPINGARISSRFGYRKHPVLGYRRKHKGLDFAAPRGTKIFAAGSGTINTIGRKGSYGNYIRIKHNNTYSTAYAHMSKFNRKLRKYSRVTQGQIIGYVGTTGRSTGPHLHYEVLKNGIRINPAKFKGTSGIKLASSNLKKFRKHIDNIEELKIRTIANSN